MTTENLPSDNQEDMLILVDSSDNEIGFLSKSECHMGAGQLHRAFSVFIFNSSGEVLRPKQSPIPDKVYQGFWEACNEGRLVIQYCHECDMLQHPPLWKNKYWR